ncbi:hypothetical protein [Streptomyces sp. NPDC056061]|uniref:hypothetical protein n=1 Tax=Streptomyces sp. NPDC056061 TaxID=3345700 RepID=UPI0035D8B1AC
MTTPGPQGDSDGLAPNSLSTYDLIICHNERIVFHDHYESAEQRLRTCVSILVNSDVLTGTITSGRAIRIQQLHSSHVAQWSTRPDEVVNAIAELCRGWGIQLHMSSTRKKNTAPAVLYSVITKYGPDQAVTELFASKEERIASLIERAEHFFTSPGHIPPLVLADERRLAALVATLLMPATVTLTESALDEDAGVYRPADTPHTIR